MSVQIINKADWLNSVYSKSDSERSRIVAGVALKMFEVYFCEKSQGCTAQEKIENYISLSKQENKEEGIRQICLDLGKFVQFLKQDHPEIKINEQQKRIFKKKTPKTIKNYFGFIKAYLRYCYGIKLPDDDIKDYAGLPKLRKERRRAISPKTLKKIVNAKIDPTRKALYLTLISSGMRLGEALALRKNNFHANESPVRITIDAETTKTLESRETFISSEAYEEVKPILDSKNDNDLVFTNQEINHMAVSNEEAFFSKLRERLGEKDKEILEKYPNSCRHIVNIHAMRAYFNTKASQKHGSDYAHAMIGHGGYLQQYYREDEDPKLRGEKYKELEPSLLISSYKPESEKAKDEKIDNLQTQLNELQAQMKRWELIKQNP